MHQVIHKLFHKIYNWMTSWDHRRPHNGIDGVSINRKMWNNFYHNRDTDGGCLGDVFLINLQQSPPVGVAMWSKNLDLVNFDRLTNKLLVLGLVVGEAVEYGVVVIRNCHCTVMLDPCQCIRGDGGMNMAWNGDMLDGILEQHFGAMLLEHIQD